MKKDTQKTKVLFLMEQPDSDISANVFAFFPDMNYYSEGNIGYGKVTKDNWQDMKTSYAHIGQHSACHIDYANKCLQATQEEYKALKIELEGLGYDLEVLNEQPPAPIKEDAKHTPGEWEWKQSRGNNFFEHIVYSGITVIAELGKTAIGNKEEIPEIKANAALIALCPTLLKENEQLKRDVKMLREAAKNFMYNWEALGNANDYSHTATRIAEALSQTETN